MADGPQRAVDGDRTDGRRRPLAVRAALAAWLLATLGASAVAGPAAAESCRFAAGASSWGPIDVVTGVGLAGSCTPDATDVFTVPAGAHVTCVDDIVFAPSSSGPEVTVEPGGQFTCRTADGIARLGLATRLFCQDGATCVLQGDHLRLGVPVPSFQPTLPLERHLAAGQPIPCGGWDASEVRWVSDCDEALSDPGDVPGSRFELVLRYDLAAPDAPAFLGESLGAIEAERAAGFTLYATVEDDDASLDRDDPADENFQYEIVGADPDWQGAGQEALLVLEMSQSDPLDRKDSAYPLEQRAYATGTLQVALPVGSVGRLPTLVQTQDSVLPDDMQECQDMEGAGPCERFEHYHPRQGQWVAFDCQQTGLPCDWFKISRTRDAADTADVPRLFGSCATPPCDRVEIYDPRGLPSALPAGTALWISPAPIHRGDPLTVQRRLHIYATGSQSIGGSSRGVSLVGNGTTFDNVLVEDFTVLIADVDGLTSSYVHVRDPYWGAASTGIDVDLACTRDLQLDHWQLSGGADASAPKLDTPHGYRIRSCADESFDGPQLFTHNALRYVGDDHWGMATARTVSVEIRRSRAQFRSLLADSASAVQTGGVVSQARLVDFECTRCSSADFSPEVGTAVVSPNVEVEGMIVWGLGSQLGDPVDYEPDSGLEWRDLFVLGAPVMLPNRLRGGVVVLGYNAEMNIGQNGPGAIRGQTDHVHGLLVRDLEIASRNFGRLSFVMAQDYLAQPAGDLRIANAAFWNLEYTAATPCDLFHCGLMRLQPSLDADEDDRWSMDDVTVLWRAGSQPAIHTALLLQGEADGSAEVFDIEGLAMAHLSEQSGSGLPQALGPTQDAAAVQQSWEQTDEGPCFWQVDVLGSPDPTPSLPPTTTTATDPAWTDPAGGRYESVPLRARGCGARPGRLSPGLHGPLRMESWLRVPAESMAGIGVDAPGPEAVMIRNGDAPPAPANTVDDGRYAADELYVRNVDCPQPEVVEPGAACALPGPATDALLAAGGSVGFNATVLDDSTLRLQGGAVAGRLSARDRAWAIVESGSVGHTAEARDEAGLVVLHGQVAGGLRLHGDATGEVRGGQVAGARVVDDGRLRVSGGLWSAPVVLEDESMLVLVGTAFAIDGLPVPPGAVVPSSGTVEVTATSGGTFELDFTRGPSAGVSLVAPDAIPALPGGAPLWAVLGWALAGRLWLSRRRAQSSTSKAWLS